jgi:carnitine O-acetyltransferase
MATYIAENDAKADFDDVYTASTPHRYIEAMANTGYEIGEQARPYCVATAEHLRDSNGHAFPVQMLDLGCSYGMGSAFVKFGCSFDEMVAFFSTRVPQEYKAASEAVRMWLNVTPPACDIRCVGLDSSEPAIRFGLDAGLLDGGIARNYELDGVLPTAADRAWFRSCNLLISTGAIGYVTERTLNAVLQDFGKDHPGEFGPCAVFTVLRMFDAEPVKEVFERHGFAMQAVRDARLPQRKFADSGERKEVLSLLLDRGFDTGRWEEQGKLFADLYVAARPDRVSKLAGLLTAVRNEANDDSCIAGYIRR